MSATQSWWICRTYLQRVSVIELAADKGAQKVLMPSPARKTTVRSADDLATKVAVVYYADAKDAPAQALSE